MFKGGNEMKHPEVSSIGIIGAGLIGGSLTVLTTGHGYKTVCVVRRPEMIPVYKEKYDTCFSQIIAQGLMPANQREICEKYLHYAEDISALKDCEIIFECVYEDLELKHEIYAKIEELCPNVRTVCSVSSSFTADMLTEKATILKDKLIVAHPFNPPHMVLFFEICAGAETDSGVPAFAKEVLDTLNRKTVILKKPAPGFIGNRLQAALWREALYLVESGICDARDVDTSLKYSFCPRYTSIGIFEHKDMGGLLLNQTVSNTIFPTLSNIDKAPQAITDRVERGDIGYRAESMKGFYDWNDVDMDAYLDRVNAPYWSHLDWDLPEE